MKLLGGILIFAAALWTAISNIRRRRREMLLLRELAAALLQIEGAVRWKKEPLPDVISRQSRRRLCGAYFAGVMEKMAAGETLQEAWSETFAALRPREIGGIIGRLELWGDETQLCGSLHLTAQQLEQWNQEKSCHRAQEEKLYLGLLLSGAGMLIILLI